MTHPFFRACYSLCTFESPGETNIVGTLLEAGSARRIFISETSISGVFAFRPLF